MKPYLALLDRILTEGSVREDRTGTGTVEIFRYADMLRGGEPASAHTLHAHTANCYCIEFDPSGEHFAVGGADAVVSVWSASELVCLRTCTRLEWPVRTLSFSHDGAYLASGSEDTCIDVASVATGEQARSIPTGAPMNSVAWHPSKLLLAFAGDDKDKMGRDVRSWPMPCHTAFNRLPRASF